MKKLLCLFTLIVLVSLTACDRKDRNSQTTDAGPSEQKPAPDILVVALDGSPLKLSDLKGKVVLLNFWATWCPPCREEIPSMVKLNNLMSDKLFRMIAVSIDDGSKLAVESYLKNNGFILPAFIDPSNKAAKTYGITGVPETFIIDKNGVIVKKVIGPLVWDSPEVVAFLEGLMK